MRGKSFGSWIAISTLMTPDSRDQVPAQSRVPGPNLAGTDVLLWNFASFPATLQTWNSQICI